MATRKTRNRVTRHCAQGETEDTAHTETEVLLFVDVKTHLPQRLSATPTPFESTFPRHLPVLRRYSVAVVPLNATTSPGCDTASEVGVLSSCTVRRQLREVVHHTLSDLSWRARHQVLLVLSQGDARYPLSEAIQGVCVCVRVLMSHTRMVLSSDPLKILVRPTQQC